MNKKDLEIIKMMAAEWTYSENTSTSGAAAACSCARTLLDAFNLTDDDIDTDLCIVAIDRVLRSVGKPDSEEFDDAFSDMWNDVGRREMERLMENTVELYDLVCARMTAPASSP